MIKTLNLKPRTIEEMPPEEKRTEAEKWEACYAGLLRQVNEMTKAQQGEIPVIDDNKLDALVRHEICNNGDLRLGRYVDKCSSAIIKAIRQFLKREIGEVKPIITIKSVAFPKEAYNTLISNGYQVRLLPPDNYKPEIEDGSQK